MNTPSFQEDHISQVPALQLLQNLGYTYLRPQEVILQRKGRFSNVLLEGILTEQLPQDEPHHLPGRAARVHGSATSRRRCRRSRTSRSTGWCGPASKIYDLLALGKALEQTH